MSKARQAGMAVGSLINFGIKIAGFIALGNLIVFVGFLMAMAVPPENQWTYIVGVLAVMISIGATATFIVVSQTGVGRGFSPGDRLSKILWGLLIVPLALAAYAVSIFEQKR